MSFLAKFWVFISRVAIGFAAMILLSLGLCGASRSSSDLAVIGFYGTLLGGAGLLLTAAIALLAVIVSFFAGGGSAPPPTIK